MKPNTAKSKTDNNQAPALPRLNYEIDQFCEAAGITRGLFYKLKREGAGPKTIKVGRRHLVPVKAAEEWIASLMAD